MAIRNKLSSKAVMAPLAVGATDEWRSDGDGLYLRVRPGNSRTWYYWFTSPTTGKRPKLKLGDYPAMSLEEARVAADAPRKLVASGIDPIEHAEQEQILKAIGDAPRTVQDLLDRWTKGWLEHHRSDKGKETLRMLGKHAMPMLGKLELERLRAPHIAAMLSKIKESGKLRTTHLVLGDLRQMFSYAVECGWMQGDPTAAMKKKTWGGPKVLRERTLSEDEIKLLQEKIRTANLAPEIECAIWIMLSCMTRVEETSLAQLKHLDLKAGTWFIPAANQKKVRGGNKDLLVDLSPFALKWFRRLTYIPLDRAERKNARLPKSKRRVLVPQVEVDYLFPSRKRPGSIDNKTIAHALDDRQQPGQEPRPGKTLLVDALVLPGGKWASHDLRRTGATLMRELGTPSDVVDRCQNHRESNLVTRTYQRSELRAEMRAGWLRLGAHLESILGLDQPEDI